MTCNYVISYSETTGAGHCVKWTSSGPVLLPRVVYKSLTGESRVTNLRVRVMKHVTRVGHKSGYYKSQVCCCLEGGHCLLFLWCTGCTGMSCVPHHSVKIKSSQSQSVEWFLKIPHMEVYKRKNNWKIPKEKDRQRCTPLYVTLQNFLRN
jgi:hypothetical protein